MPRQNRVQPTGAFLAHPARGALMGNRGILHDSMGRLGAARWRHKAWVCCLTAFKGRRRALMAPGHYTELFFHDEAVALAAGHRPCGECRRSDLSRFLAAAGLVGKVADFDRTLHVARALPRVFQQRRIRAEIGALPEGAFILPEDGTPGLIWQGGLRVFSPQGYGAPVRLPQGQVTVLTPGPSLTALRNGYVPQVGIRA